MQNSKLVQLLNNLDRETFTKLGSFVESPFFNKNERLIRFYHYLNRYYPGLFSPQLKKEKVHQYVFDKKKYSDDRMRQLMHKMMVLTESFLAVHEALSSESSKARLLLQALDKRNLYSFLN